MKPELRNAQGTSDESVAAAARGWGFPMLCRKAHYFIGPVSLCGSWAYAGNLDDTDHYNPDNCKACMHKRAKLTTAVNK